jgi:hypothetical protein
MHSYAIVCKCWGNGVALLFLGSTCLLLQLAALRCRASAALSPAARTVLRFLEPKPWLSSSGIHKMEQLSYVMVPCLKCHLEKTL